MYVPVDVNFPDDDKIEQVGLDGAGLYVFAVCIAKRTKSDGVVTRLKLRRNGATDDLIDRLIGVGLLEAHADDAVRICAYLAHNPSAASLMDGGKMAHTRWHTNKGVFKPGCPHCAAENTQVNAETCEDDAQRSAKRMRDAHAEGEGEWEGEYEREGEEHTPADPSETIDLELTNDTSPAVTASDPFDEFWNAHPKKVRKTFAKTAYRQALKVADAETIRAGLDRHLPAYQAIVDAGEKQFIPKPENWLRGHCWNDDPPEPRNTATKRPSAIDDAKQNLLNQLTTMNGTSHDTRTNRPAALQAQSDPSRNPDR